MLLFNAMENVWLLLGSFHVSNQTMQSKLTCLTIVLVGLISNSVAMATDFRTSVAPFLKKHCVKCHGSEKQNGERRFDVLPETIQNSNTLADYQDILDQLNLGEMPPADEAQPADTERRAMVAWLTQSIDAYHAGRKTHAGETILRRLNSREYLNTVRDLLHLNTTMFNPTSNFPRDQAVEHLDNIGDTLVTSGFLLQQYLQAAELVIDKALYPMQKPVTQKWAFNDNFKQQPEIDQVHRTTNKFNHITLYDVIGADKHEGAYAPIHDFQKGVPFDGNYRLRFKAQAINRVHPYPIDFVGTNPDEPLRLGIVPGNFTAGPLHKPQPIEPLLTELDLSDEAAVYTATVWLDKGYTPRFTFRNGLMDVRNMWGKMAKRFADDFPKGGRPGIVTNRFNSIKFGKLPQIHVDDIEIEGPLLESWPTDAQNAMLGPDAETILTSGRMSETQMRQQLKVFASRAYRRPATGEELDRVMQIIQRQQQQQRPDVEAYADGLKTVLCSPAFLYLEEPTVAGLSPTGLATRLSYFLWSSMPDDVLLNNADNLKSSEKLRAEVSRMLADPRSDAFVEGFLGTWLTLRDFGSQPPDRDDFARYYHYELGSAMQEETRRFARHLLDENLSVLNFVDSDFTFVNRRLAEHYGLKMAAELDHQFVKVPLTDARRGGLLGQGSVLTVTANGIDTSPVVRGVWLLENLLGTPPSPPPPDIEPLDPDIRGAKSIRDQLEKHRTNASCNDCHRRIDPMGFALENFDPIGQWRTTYSKNVSIDAAGQLPNGQKYDDIVGFKKILMKQQDLFLRSLTSKLLSYATGRQMEAEDRPAIDDITAELAKQGYGFTDLIQLVVNSQTFLK